MRRMRGRRGSRPEVKPTQADPESQIHPRPGSYRPWEDPTSTPDHPDSTRNRREAAPASTLTPAPNRPQSGPDRTQIDPTATPTRGRPRSLPDPSRVGTKVTSKRPQIDRKAPSNLLTEADLLNEGRGNEVRDQKLCCRRWRGDDGSEDRYTRKMPESCSSTRRGSYLQRIWRDPKLPQKTNHRANLALGSKIWKKSGARADESWRASFVFLEGEGGEKGESPDLSGRSAMVKRRRSRWPPFGEP